MENTHKYDDIIHMQHPISTKHPPMSLHDRAAQFSPFAALTGYEDAITETARLTDSRIELSESERELLDEKLLLLSQEMDTASAEVTAEITYFVPDERKAGGTYRTVSGRMKKLDTNLRVLVMEDGGTIGLDDIVGIESKIFNKIFL